MSDNLNNKNYKSFNIYYLNFQKVYEISMMMNNVITTKFSREDSSYSSRNAKLGGSLTAGAGNQQFLAGIKAVISPELKEERGKSSKIVESLEVKTTKSTLLSQIIAQSQLINHSSKLDEGDLIKIDKVKLKIFDERNLRGIQIFRKNALEDFRMEGFNVNNLIKALIHDYTFVLEGDLEGSESGETKKILFRIPMSLENEFESQYTVDDLLIGTVSIIGIYKGRESQESIKANTFNYYTTQGQSPINTNNELEVISSNSSELTSTENADKNEIAYEFIDVIAIIQDIKFNYKQSKSSKKDPNPIKKVFERINFWKK